MSGKRKHPVLNITDHLMYSYRWTIIGYWIVFLMIYIGIGILLNSNIIVDEDMDKVGVWEGASVSPKIFLLVIGILLTPMSLASFVSNGITRRHFVLGVSVSIAAFSAIFAVMMTAGYPIEQLIYDQNNWPLELRNPHLFTSTSQLGWIFFEYFCLFFTYFGSGWLIGTGFYRFNWRIGVLITLVALLPSIAMEVLLSSDWMGSLMQSVLEVQRTPLAALVLLALLILGLIVLVNFMMLRRVAIKRKTF
ncbi:hypothetical protein [Paenibacillus luteus]|uniref:hypothetical protein n=1 Tax=Paenibacillus luteus TaxID=2545753 RepID=UPI0011447510|nr:hypothetical protein [Paenibacillus luteus]